MAVLVEDICHVHADVEVPVTMVVVPLEGGLVGHCEGGFVDSGVVLHVPCRVGGMGRCRYGMGGRYAVVGMFDALGSNLCEIVAGVWMGLCGVEHDGDGLVGLKAGGAGVCCG